MKFHATISAALFLASFAFSAPQAPPAEKPPQAPATSSRACPGNACQGPSACGVNGACNSCGACFAAKVMTYNDAVKLAATKGSPTVLVTFKGLAPVPTGTAVPCTVDLNDPRFAAYPGRCAVVSRYDGERHEWTSTIVNPTPEAVALSVSACANGQCAPQNVRVTRGLFGGQIIRSSPAASCANGSCGNGGTMTFRSFGGCANGSCR